MSTIRLLSAVEQVAMHLRERLIAGSFGLQMPGIHQLAAELQVNHKTVVASIRLLERDGLLLPQGKGRPRRVVIPKDIRPPKMRFGILAHDAANTRQDYMVELRHQLAEAGHTVFFAPTSLIDLKMDVERIGRMMKRHPADAWLAVGASREVLEWLVAREEPAMAVFGRRRGLAIAGVGPDKPPAMRAATRELIRLGHRWIVLLVRELRRSPAPGASERAFLGELSAHQIVPGPYHIPAWVDDPAGLHERLESMFKFTPPSALIVDEANLYLAVLQFAARRSIAVPGQLSLICTDGSADFDWCQPSIAHIRWNPQPLLHRILRWAGNVARGHKDIRQTLIRAEFVTGGSIARAGRLSRA